MLFKNKGKIFISVMLVFNLSAQAGPLSGALTSVATQAAGQVASSLVKKFDNLLFGESLVDISNSTIDNKVKISGESFLLASNLGIKLNGRQVIVENSTIKNDVQATEINAIFANLGIELEGEKITITNSDIVNSLKAEGLTILGGNVGISLGGG